MKDFKVSNETKVGALTAIAITVLVLGYNFLRGKDLFTSTKTYYAIYNRVDGLSGSNPVTINGYRVGQIIGVELLEEDSMKIRIEIEVLSKIKVGQNSIAKIYNLDLFGSKAIELVLAGGEPLVENGGKLKSDMEASLTSSISEIVAPLKNKIENLVVSLDSVFGGESGEKLRLTIAHAENISKNLSVTSNRFDDLVAKEAQRLDDILANVQSISSNLKGNNENITSIIDNLKEVSDTLAAANLKQVINNAERVLSEVSLISEKINKGEGSVGLLINDKQLYDNLKNSSQSLDDLLKDLKAHPKRYVHFSIFGKKEKK